MESRDEQLSPLDQQALDALVEAGFDPGLTPEPVRERCQKLAAIFGVLESPAPGRSLVDRTMEHVRAVRGLTEDTLCPADAAALDALIAAEYDLARVGEPLRERAGRLSTLGATLTGATQAARSADLVGRTFGLVMLAADRPVAKVEPVVLMPRARWRDLVGAAAMLLVGASVVIPVMSASRQQQLRGGCAANLGSIASAMSSYASTYRDSLPVATASMGGGKWWDVGGAPEHSNSANLFTLARTGFAKVKDLACPGNACACENVPSPQAMDWRSIEHVSYSYQIMFGEKRTGWLDPSRTAVLADRSPVILRALAGEQAIPTENSPNHARRGQSVLFCDGSVVWQNTPELVRGDHTDNIWLPWQVEEILRQIGAGQPVTLEGMEVPGSGEDAFLAP